MSLFVKVATDIFTDEKFLLAGPEASWVWLRGFCYAKLHLTDDYIPGAAVLLVTHGCKNPEQICALLVEVGLWKKDPRGGYTVGAERWAKWQTTKEEVAEKRQKVAERVRKWREKKRDCNSVTSEPCNASVTPPEHRAQSTE